MAAPSTNQAGAEAGASVCVWDPLVRIFHWTLATAFLGAFLLVDPRALHENLGWIALAAVGTRIVWGLVGPGYARFTGFVPTPGRFLAYCRNVLRGRERRYLGHNPAGGAMIVALLAMVAILGVTGWMMSLDAYWGVSWVQQLHGATANLALGLVILHVAGVIWASRRHGENLVAAMFTGRKRR